MGLVRKLLYDFFDAFGCDIVSALVLKRSGLLIFVSFDGEEL